MSIDDDAYFELMMNNCWKINNASTKLNDKKGDMVTSESTNQKSLQDNYQAKQNRPDTSNKGRGQNNRSDIFHTTNVPEKRGGRQEPEVSLDSAHDQLKNKNTKSDIFHRAEEQPKRGGRPQTSQVAQEEPQQQRFEEQPTEPQREMNKASIQILDKFRERLLARGAKGIIGLQRQFKIFDDNNSKTLEFTEFLKACKDFKVDLNNNEIKILFNAFDSDGSGVVEYNEFLREVRGQMNDFRKKITLQAFDKLDLDRSGVVEIGEIKSIYNCKHHPDVKSGRKTEEDVYGEFIETFEMHHGNTKGRKDKRVTTEEFLEYYNNISASIDSDEYYEVMMNNAWKLTSQPEYLKNDAWTNKEQTATVPKRQVKSTSPFGVSDQKTSYETSNSNQGRSGIPNKKGVNDALLEESVVDKFRSKLKARGTRGIMSIRRCFMICDDDNSKSLNFYELDKICNDYRFGLSKNEVQALFKAFDLNNNGSIDYEEFLHGVVGEMNNFRSSITKRAFEKLDRDHSGVVEVEDIRGVYNGKYHPDVLSGRKTEDEILAEFLDTFEYHFTLLVI